MKRTYHTEDHEDNGHVSILKRSRASFKAPGLVPSGTWTLRCLSAKHRTMQITDKDGTEREIDVVTFTHEPLTPGRSVDPDEAGAVDPQTGRSPFDGKRIFTTIRVYNSNDLVTIERIMSAHLGEADPDSDFASDLARMRGMVAQGDVYVDSWVDKLTGETRSDNKVRSWAAAE